MERGDTATAAASGLEQANGLPEYAGPWFMSPFMERLLDERGLDADQQELVRSYARNGYLVLDDLGLADFDGIADRVEASLAPLHEDGAYNRIAEAWSISPEVRTIATAPKVLSILELLYGRRPIPFQTLNFWRGSQQATHSDAIHFHSFPKQMMCGVWTALEDTDDRNGALHYYPGSHLFPDLEYADLGLRAGKRVYPRYEEFVGEMIASKGLKKEQPFLKRGQALIWSANLLHGGDPVTDPQSTRVSQVTHYYFDGCSYYTPLRSDIARGKIFFRQIVDVGTGRLQPARVDGGRVPIPLTSRLVTWQRALMRKLGRGVQRHPR
jgi:hypothetical protein